METITISKTDSERIRQKVTYSSNKKLYSAQDIQKLVSEINKANIIEQNNMPPDVVTMNSVVKIKNLDKNMEFTLQLVYPEDADPKKQKISIFAPIGTALLGYRKGDVVNWILPNGKVKIQIEDIIYQPEASGDFHL